MTRRDWERARREQLIARAAREYRLDRIFDEIDAVGQHPEDCYKWGSPPSAFDVTEWNELPRQLQSLLGELRIGSSLVLARPGLPVHLRIDCTKSGFGVTANGMKASRVAETAGFVWHDARTARRHWMTGSMESMAVTLVALLRTVLRAEDPSDILYGPP